MYISTHSTKESFPFCSPAQRSRVARYITSRRDVLQRKQVNKERQLIVYSSSSSFNQFFFVQSYFSIIIPTLSTTLDRRSNTGQKSTVRILTRNLIAKLTRFFVLRLTFMDPFLFYNKYRNKYILLSVSLVRSRTLKICSGAGINK